MSVKILVVDDSPDIVYTVNRVLDGAGYAVSSAATREEALSRIDANDDFDIILLDILMPGMTASDFLRHLKKRDVAARVIYLTGVRRLERASIGRRGEKSFVVDSSRELVADYIEKPFSAEELKAKIQSALESSAGKASGK